MPTLLEIKTLAASYLDVSVADLTVNGIDLGLSALNSARNSAELLHDFSFQRKLLSLTVNSSTGGSLEDVVIYGTSTSATIKTIIEMGQFDTYGNFRPVEWTTAEEGQERMRGENPFWGLRYPTDGQAISWPMGQQRLVLRGDTVELWPKTDEAASDITIGIEAYVFDDDWLDQDLTATTIAVTGTLSPDVTGTYSLEGLYNGAGLYRNGAYLLRKLAVGGWTLGAGSPWGEDGDVTGLWQKDSTPSATSPAGTYSANPTSTGSATVTLGNSATNIWTTRGADYLQWAAIVELNKRFKSFVPRQEGNLSEPTAMADAALQQFITWDIYKAEGFRRHGR